MPTMSQLVFENAMFLLFTLPCLVWGWRRYDAQAAFPGPVTPWPAWFKVWFRVIWLVGIALPLGVSIYYVIRGEAAVAAVALGAYFFLFVIQIATELTCIRFRSPVWVAVPCLYLPWRLVQLERGLSGLEPEDGLMRVTLWLLIALWTVNIWVHFSGIPNQMRWHRHGDSLT